jgi:class 3 adenylate cyclase/tetratricopeptide (TPR) repeat protein
MQCSRCHAENKEGRRFCARCGSPLARECPVCHFANEREAEFCGGCGSALASQAGSPEPFGSPKAYTPEHLAERILNVRSALEGERKQVSVLFADLRNSMELLADRDPEEARRILDPVLERMMAAVHRYEGTVNQVMGDGIMALFGAPVAHEDHAIRAGYAALKMQELIAELAHQTRRQDGVEVQIRVGLNAGEVVVRGIGNDLTMDYTAIGQTTHLAARMEQLAAPGTILVTEAFTRLTEGYLHFKPLGLMQVKGLSEPFDVYQLIDAEPTRSRFQAASSSGATRFVGRQGELESLQTVLARTQAGSGHVVAVVGEPGVGKSRLFHELVRSSHMQGSLVLETGSVSYAKTTPWMPVRELLRTYFQIDERDGAVDSRDRVVARVTALDHSLHDTLPAVLWLLDLPVEDPAWRVLDPEHRRQSALEGVRRLLFRQSRVQPLLLVFENLQWIDAESQVFLNRLVESLPAGRILLLVSYRPEYSHAWANKTYYTQIRLGPLASGSAEELLRALLGNGPELAPLKALLIERTQGNPFFLEESARALIETRVLVGQRGAFRLAKELSSIRVPATVQAILAARIDRLSADEKRLLQSAAVIGREFSLPLLQSIVGAGVTDLAGDLARLQAAEFFYESSLFPEIGYTFKHVLIQEVAYDSLLQQRRQTLHARIVEVLETLQGDRLANEVEQLAHHARLGEIWEKAATYARQAGTRALDRSANREAIVFLEQAGAALERRPQTPETMREAIDIRLDLRRALVPLADRGRILDHMQKAEALARTLGDQRRLGWVTYGIAHCHYLANEQEQTVEAGRRALALSGGNDIAHEVAVNILLGYSFHVTGAYREATVVLRRNIDVLGDRVRERFGLPIFPAFPAVTSRERLVRCLAELGEFTEAIRVGEEGLRIAEDIDHPTTLAAMCLGLGTLHMRRDDLARATPVLERGLAVGRRWSIFVYAFTIIAAVGRAYALTGRVKEGLALITEGVEGAEVRQSALGHGVRLAWLAEAHLVAGDYDRAWSRAQQALELSRQYGERGQEAWTLHLLGEIAARRDPADAQDAASFYRQALTIAAALGMRPALAYCELGLGELNVGAGHADVGRKHLTSAARLFQDLGMTAGQQRAERQLGELSG